MQITHKLKKTKKTRNSKTKTHLPNRFLEPIPPAADPRTTPSQFGFTVTTLHKRGKLINQSVHHFDFLLPRDDRRAWRSRVISTMYVSDLSRCCTRDIFLSVRFECVFRCTDSLNWKYSSFVRSGIWPLSLHSHSLSLSLVKASLLTFFSL